MTNNVTINYLEDTPVYKDLCANSCPTGNMYTNGESTVYRVVETSKKDEFGTTIFTRCFQNIKFGTVLDPDRKLFLKPAKFKIEVTEFKEIT